ncbi:MAG: SDR family oxidoreductase [Gammaproteobacteria bacterium]|nr:SDR family oxidoreductase [Gammaproteobacteria bacterium]
MKAAEMFKVEGYGAIVTGGASGLGLAFTEVLAEHGARVTVFDLDQQRIDSEVQRLSALGYDVSGMRVDVTDRADMHDAFAQVHATYGRLDVVFANAGIDSGPGFVTLDRTQRVSEGAIENYEDARWNKVIETNLNSVFTTVKAAARYMKPQRSGRIIITTSAAALLIESGVGAAYMAAKAGVAHFMRTMAQELARYQVTVNAIAPGPFITNIGGGHAFRPEVQEAFGATVPLGRMASTEEIKGLALLLASPASSFITGAQISIDGGATLGQLFEQG